MTIYFVADILHKIKTMFKKYAILAGLITAVALLVIAAIHYPGGSSYNVHSVGYSWQHNYISNLFNEKAINGSESTSRFWAAGAMFFLSSSIGIFFIQFSKKIPVKSAANIIKYFGAVAMVATFLIITPLHDIMVNISATLALVSIFYITVFILKSTLLVLKLLLIAYLLIAYTCIFIYNTGLYLQLLPVMQKVALAVTIIWVLGVNYFADEEDFKQAKKARAVSVKEAISR